MTETNDRDTLFQSRLRNAQERAERAIQTHETISTTSRIDDLFDLNSAHSLSLGRNIRRMITALNTDLPPLDIIKLCNYLCNKMYDYYRMSVEYRDKIIAVLTQTVLDAEQLPINVRLYFLRFRNEYIGSHVAENSYNAGIRERIDRIPYLQLLKYLLRSTFIPHLHAPITTELQEMFADPRTTEFERMEIADIHMLSGLHLQGEQMLDVIRENERMRVAIEDRRQVLQNPGSANYTVYEDSQNVHNSSINTSVLKTTFNLIKKMQSNEYIRQEVEMELFSRLDDSTLRSVITKILDRIEIDTSYFTYSPSPDEAQTRMTMYVAFSNLWAFIKRSQHRDELLIRLVEEMCEMHNYCSSGHLARFMSVIQGFTDEPDLQIQISELTRLRAVVTHFLTLKLRTAPDSIQESMIANDPSPFYRFVANAVNSQLDIWKGEFDISEQLLQDICTILTAYTGYEGWNVEGELISM